jgi:hypothetical protein
VGGGGGKKKRLHNEKSILRSNKCVSISELIVRCIGNECGENKSQSFSFNDLRISYTNLINKTCQRKRELKEQYYFNCSCIKCGINETPESTSLTAIREIEQAKEGSMMCPNCQNCVLILPTSGKAQVCLCLVKNVLRLNKVLVCRILKSLHNKYII